MIFGITVVIHDSYLKMKKILTTILCLTSILAFGQTLSVSSTESRCINSGTITVTFNSGTPSYSFRIYDGPNGDMAPNYPITQISSANTNVFYDLIPGKYYIQVTDQNTTLYDSAVVEGNYSEPLFSLEGTDVTCPGGNDGVIYVDTAFNGRLNYTYQIISPYIGSVQSSDTFSDLTEGVYQIRMYDSCGNYQTRSYTLGLDYEYVWITYFGYNSRISCDSAKHTLKAYHGTLPYTYRVLDPDDLTDTIQEFVSISEIQAFDLPIRYNGDANITEYRFEVEDACGQTSYYGRGFDNFYFPDLLFGCDSTELTFGGDDYNGLFLDSLKLVFNPNPYGWDTLTVSTDSSDYTKIKFPNGSRSFTAYSQCGDSFTHWFGAIPPILDSVTLDVLASYCEVGKLYVDIEVPYDSNYNRPAAPYTFLIYKDGQFFDSLIDQQYYYYSDEMDPGLYEVWAWNSCGDTAYNLVNAQDTLNASIQSESFTGCGLGDGSIISKDSTSPFRNTFFQLFDATRGVQIDNYNDSGKFYNLDTGVYYVDMLQSGSWCTLVRDTVHVGSYVQPELSAQQVSCINGTYAIKANASKGVAPYTYYLRDPNNSFAVIRGPSSSDTFLNLTSGSYNILVEDACGNTVNSNASPYIPDLDISQVNGAYCAFEELQIGADTILQSLFSWTGPNGFSSVDRLIKFSPVYNSDSGQYILSGDILGGCLLTSDTFDVDIDSLTVGAVDTMYKYCSADSIEIFLEASSIMNNEKGFWTVISAPLGSVYHFNNDSLPITSFVTDLIGLYEFSFTVRGANGCQNSVTANINVECPTNMITGTVFLDDDSDGYLDLGETGTPGVTVYLFDDLDNDGILDVSEMSPIDSLVTNGSGFYSFDVYFNKSMESYILNIDTLDLPTNSSLTTDNIEVASFTSGGNVDPNNDFGHDGCSLAAGISSPDSGCANEDQLFVVNPAPSGATYAWTFDNGTPGTSTAASQLVSWSSPGTHNVELIVSDASCVDTFNTSILINSAVVASAAPNDTVCQGGSIDLDATASTSGANYVWAVQSGDPFSIDANGTTTTPTVSPLVNTVYSLTVTDPSSGCSNVAFVTVNVDVNLNPTAAIVTTSGSICSGNEIVVDGDGSSLASTGNPIDYEWFVDGSLVATGQDSIHRTLIGPSAMNFELVVEDQVTGCTDTIDVDRTAIICENTITGVVWFDEDEDQTIDATEFGQVGATVYLIDDANGNGVRNTGEALLDSAVTEDGGLYGFTVDYIQGTYNYLVVSDTVTYPSLTYQTTDDLETASFSTSNQNDGGNNFGFGTNDCSGASDNVVENTTGESPLNITGGADGATINLDNMEYITIDFVDTIDIGKDFDVEWKGGATGTSTLNLYQSVDMITWVGPVTATTSGFGTVTSTVTSTDSARFLRIQNPGANTVQVDALDYDCLIAVSTGRVYWSKGQGDQ